ncbi:MAG: hypothetical protein ACE5Z5_01825 [Candidatus Bathyarchaeia archaeon]
MVSKTAITPELYEFIVKVVDERVKEIRVTREAFTRLENAIVKLTEAQARSEERLTRLEDSVTELSRSVHELSRSVGALGQSVGFGLEDIVKVVLPGWLERHEGVSVDRLERRFFLVDREVVEINLYGEGLWKERNVVILGEARSRIYGRDVLEFKERAEKAAGTLEAVEVYKVVFGYWVQPSAEEECRRHGITPVASYMR